MLKKEQLEKLIVALFYKFLRPEFTVVRSSEYDEVVNEIDIVVLEKKSDNMICAFVEVGDDYGPEFERKKLEFLKRRNIREAGGKLKYAIGVEDGKVVPKPLRENIPVFYLALSEEILKKGVEESIPSLEEKSDYEKRLFKFFISLILSEISYLELSWDNLNPRLKEQLSSFKKACLKYK